jgi:hypothetical protein
LSDKAATATYAAITLPDRVTEIDLMLPDIDLTSLVNPAALSQIPNLRRVQAVDLEGATWEADDSLTIPITPQQQRIREAKAPTPAIPGPEEEMIEDEGLFNAAIQLPPPIIDERMEVGDYDLGGAEFAPVSPIPQVTPRGESPPPGPPPAQAPPAPPVQQGPPRVPRKRVRGLIVDEETEIDAQDFKRLLTNTRDIVRIRQRAPATREEYEDQREERDIWTDPLFPRSTLPPEYLDMYREATAQYNIRTVAREIQRGAIGAPPAVAPSPILASPAQRPPSVERQREEQQFMEAGDYDLGGAEFAPLPEEEQPVVAPVKSKRTSVAPSPISFDMDMQLHAQRNAQKRKSELYEGIVEEMEEQDLILRKQQQHQQLKTTFRDKNITESTVQVIGLLQDQFEVTQKDKIVLQDMTEGMKRIAAARCFYETLVLKTRGFIDVKQDRPYGPIEITNVGLQV